MERVIEEWTAKDLYVRRHLIQYPDYQREPTVWNERKKKLLIDSMCIGMDIPKLYLYKPEGSDHYDCVDGQQRIISVIEFFNGGFALLDGRRIEELSEREKNILFNYKLTVAVITHADEEELRLLFLRLQLGSPLNPGEKLHAMTGDIREFVFNVGKKHPFFQKVTISERRFARETVCAQICINSFYRSLQDSFYSARFRELKAFFKQYANLEKFREETERIIYTLDTMDKYFGNNAVELTNRASIVSAYLFFEELVLRDQIEKLEIFVEFYLEFLERLKIEAGRGLDYHREYRELLDFQYYVSQAAVAKKSITKRHEILTEYFEHYLRTKEIKRD